MEYKTYDVAFVFGVIFCTHCWWIFLIWNSGQSWLIKFWSLKIKAQKFRPPWTEILRRRKICIHPLTPFNKNITGNLAKRVDRFSLIHIFWYFEKCSSDHFKKCVIFFFLLGSFISYITSWTHWLSVASDQPTQALKFSLSVLNHHAITTTKNVSVLIYFL